MNTHFLPEWHPQWGVLLAWPHPSTDWADHLTAAETCYSQIISAITQTENVLLLCHDAEHQAHIEQHLKANSNCQLNKVHFRQLPYNDTWARDFGPISVIKNGHLQLQDFTFNAWGGKFEAALDNAVNEQLIQTPPLNGLALQQHSLVLEGGSLETDGADTLLTTEICLLNPNRNPSLNKQQIEAQLTASLGIKRFLWLAHGHLEGDDTDAHIDTLARFASPERIVYMSCDNPQDSHYTSLQAMEQEIRALRQRNGKPYELFPIPLPDAIYDATGQRRLPASYVNFLIINQAVLLPIYGDARTDQIALQQMQLAFPDHQIIAINCCALIAQNGSLHCITMQLPQEVSP